MEKLQIILDSKESLMNANKILKFILIIRNNYKKKFFYFLGKLKLHIQKNIEINFLSKNYLFFENNYNIRLKNILLGYYKIEKILKTNEKFAINLREKNKFDYKRFDNFNSNLINNENLNLSAYNIFVNNNKQKNINSNNYISNISKNSNSIGTLNENNLEFTIKHMKKIEIYFYLWKAKSIRNSGVMKIAKDSITIRFILFNDIIYRRFLRVYSYFFSKIKSLFYDKYRNYQLIFNIFGFYLIKIKLNFENVSKKIFFEKILIYTKNKSIVECYKLKTRNIYFAKTFEKVKTSYDEKNKHIFFKKLALNIKGSLLYNWRLSMDEFIFKINRILTSRFIFEFFSRFKIISYKEPKFQSPKIDYLIMINTSEVIKNLHSSILTKTKNQKLFRLLKIFSLKYENIELHLSNPTLLKMKYFNSWLNMIDNEKKSILEDIKSYKQHNVKYFNLVLKNLFLFKI